MEADTVHSKSEDDTVEADSVAHKQACRSSAVGLKALSLAMITSTRDLLAPLPSAFNLSQNSAEEGKMEQAWLQAQYNGVVFVILALLVGITVAVYFVLEPFLHPLLWAILAGVFVFPFKRTNTNRIKQWLGCLETSGVPLSVGILLSPFTFFNYLSMQLDLLIGSYHRHLLFLVSSIVVVYLACQIGLLVLLNQSWGIVNSIFESLHKFLSFAQLLQVMQ